MVTRSITEIGLVNIGRQLRGDAMDGEVILYLAEGGIRIEPYHPERDYKVQMAVITRFDQYNRLHIPTGMRRAAGIQKSVRISIEGDALTVTPATSGICVICGKDKNPLLLPGGQHVCAACKQKIQESN